MAAFSGFLGYMVVCMVLVSAAMSAARFVWSHTLLGIMSKKNGRQHADPQSLVVP